MDEPFTSAEGKLGRVIVLRMKPGTDLLDGMLAACEKHQIRNGVIISAIGSFGSRPSGRTPAGGSGSGVHKLWIKGAARDQPVPGVVHGARPLLIEPGFLCTKARSARERGLRPPSNCPNQSLNTHTPPHIFPAPILVPIPNPLVLNQITSSAYNPTPVRPPRKTRSRGAGEPGGGAGSGALGMLARAGRAGCARRVGSPRPAEAAGESSKGRGGGRTLCGDSCHARPGPARN